MGASTLVGIGFLLFLPFHDTYVQVIVNMVIVGLGSGALVAALPAAAASAAPPTQTGVATGLTNSVKTVGGAIASCVFGDRAAERRDGRGDRGDRGVAGGLLHRVDRLRRDRARRGGRAGVRARGWPSPTRRTSPIRAPSPPRRSPPEGTS